MVHGGAAIFFGEGSLGLLSVSTVVAWFWSQVWRVLPFPPSAYFQLYSHEFRRSAAFWTRRMLQVVCRIFLPLPLINAVGFYRAWGGHSERALPRPRAGYRVVLGVDMMLVRRCASGTVFVHNHTLDNSLLNTGIPIGMSICRGIAYRYLLTPSIGMRICRSIPVAWTYRSRENGTIGYCS